MCSFRTQQKQYIAISFIIFLFVFFSNISWNTHNIRLFFFSPQFVDIIIINSNTNANKNLDENCSLDHLLGGFSVHSFILSNIKRRKNVRTCDIFNDIWNTIWTKLYRKYLLSKGIKEIKLMSFFKCRVIVNIITYILLWRLYINKSESIILGIYDAIHNDIAVFVVVFGNILV